MIHHAGGSTDSHTVPLISIIIPTCSPRIPLKSCLDSLCHQTLSAEQYEIIVVNNGGMAHSKSFLEPLLESYSGSIRLIQAGGNLGYAGGCCLGVDHATGHFLAFHNDDSIADPAWLSLALSTMQKVPDIGAVTCRIVSMDQPVIQHEGSSMTHPHGLFWQTSYGLPDRSESYRGRSVCELDFFGGCIWMTPRKVWDEAGGLSVRYHPGYYEDSEYALRCRQLGYRILLLKSVTCSHIMSATLGPDQDRFWKVFHRSRFRFLQRNQTGSSFREIIASEMAWWRDHHAGHQPWQCSKGFLSSMMSLPISIVGRTRWKRKIARKAESLLCGERPVQTTQAS